MIRLQFTEEEKQALNHERYYHPHPRVQRKMEALWLKDYQFGGIERLKEIHFRQPISELVGHQQTLEEYFKAHPPATIKEAMDKIEKLTGLKRSEPRIKKFLGKLGLKRRKVGMVPSKADPDKQETFKKNSWNPGSGKPKPEKGPSFLWMPPTSS